MQKITISLTADQKLRLQKHTEAVIGEIVKLLDDHGLLRDGLSRDTIMNAEGGLTGQSKDALITDPDELMRIIMWVDSMLKCSKKYVPGASKHLHDLSIEANEEIYRIIEERKQSQQKRCVLS